jgi:bifunctional enzyme CysN/CysC
MQTTLFELATNNIPRSEAPSNTGALIWITGYSGAGKTTVARRVSSTLLERGIQAVLLDGDDLRGVFARAGGGERFGYEREDRIALAYGYFRLCNTLVAQGVTVVLAAVAMYEEINQWVRENIDRAIQVYLEVPEGELRQRDAVTKRIYAKLGNLAELYDAPSDADLVIANSGATTPSVAAELIVSTFEKAARPSATLSADKGRFRHWEHYYSRATLVETPSDYARLTAEQLSRQSAIVEVGCGNGRDARFFSSLGHSVLALDPSHAAIEKCRRNPAGIEFFEGTLPDVSTHRDARFDAVYSRFSLHAMTEPEEIATLSAAHRLLQPGGSLHIECRSINDPLARKGEVLSPTERIHGHYRRFIIRDELHTRLESVGFLVADSVEAADVAVLGDDNPVVIRVTAIKS